jgi:hypothetical protein
MLPHFLRSATPKNNASITYLTNATDTNTRTTYTFTLTGTFDPGLYVIAPIGESQTSTATLSSMTFDSNSMTEVVKTNRNAGSSGIMTGIYSYRQTSSITNPVVTVTFSTSTARANIGVWRIDTNSNDTAYQLQESIRVNASGILRGFRVVKQEVTGNQEVSVTIRWDKDSEQTANILRKKFGN